MWYDTTRVILTSGSSDGVNELSAFDNSLFDAGIADFNLIKVSSIVPSGIPVSNFKEGVSEVLANGLLVPAVFDMIYSNNVGEKIVSGVGVGIPKDSDNKPGIIFTHTSNTSKDDVRKTLTKMVNETMRRKAFELDYIKFSIKETIVSDSTFCSFSAAVFCDDDILKLFEGKYE